MNRTVFGGIAVLALSASSAFASLIPINLVPTTGNGIGAVTTLLTFQNTGTESGCVGYSGGVTVTVAAVCLGGVVGPTHETTGSGNNTFTAAELSIVPLTANTFANLILLFNGNEGGGAADSITLQKLSLNLLDGLTGTTLGSFTITAPYFATALPGVGNAPGVGFQLDAAQAAQANQLLLLNPTLRIGASATASGANAGFETISISRINSIQAPIGDPTSAVPEPTTFLMIGAGLIGVALLKKRKIDG